jgi:hypothetical protein
VDRRSRDFDGKLQRATDVAIAATAATEAVDLRTYRLPATALQPEDTMDRQLSTQATVVTSITGCKQDSSLLELRIVYSDKGRRTHEPETTIHSMMPETRNTVKSTL